MYSLQALTLILLAGLSNAAPSCRSLKTSQNGGCGPVVKSTCLGSRYGPSCSWLGRCGLQEDFAFSGTGCQADYGICGYKPPVGVQISKDGRCNEASTCLGSNFGLCCTKQGFCSNQVISCEMAGGTIGRPSHSSSSSSVIKISSTDLMKTSRSVSSTSLSTSTSCTTSKSASSNSIQSTPVKSSPASSVTSAATTKSTTSPSTTTISTASSLLTSSPVSTNSVSISAGSTTTSRASSITISTTSSVTSSSNSRTTSMTSTTSFTTSSSSTTSLSSTTLYTTSTSTVTSSATSATALTTSIASPTSTTSTAAAGSASTTISSTTAELSSTTGYPVLTPGVSMPTHTYTGGISTFASGSPVSIQNPSFENGNAVSGSGRKQRKRQSSAQTAAAASGWTIQSCGTGTLSDCAFENYDAADGVWAFSGPNGGLIYQDSVNLAAGATYQFTFYWKVVSTYDGATSASTGNNMVQGMYLGSSTNTAVTGAGIFVPPVGSAVVQSGGDWAQQTFTLMLSCQYTHFATQLLSDGTLNFRMFLSGTTASGSQASIGSFNWYVDEIRVQEVASPSGGVVPYLENTCKTTPPAATPTSSTTTSAYTITETYAPTATPTNLGTNVVVNPSFESLTVTDYNTDVVGGAIKATTWTYTGCAQKHCELHDGIAGNNDPPVCQDGRYCEGWVAPTTYSQTISLVIGSTYFLSLWTLLQNAPTSTGAAVHAITFEPAGATPGSGGVVLSTSVTANQPDWTQYTEFLDFDAPFAQHFCGAGQTATTASCQITILTSYAGAWGVTDGVQNFFDNVVVSPVQS